MRRQLDLIDVTDPTFTEIINTVDLEKVDAHLRRENLSLLDDLECDITLVNAFAKCEVAGFEKRSDAWAEFVGAFNILRRRTTARAKDIVHTFTDEYRETKVRELEVGNV